MQAHFQIQITEAASEISEGALALIHICFDIWYFCSLYSFGYN